MRRVVQCQFVIQRMWDQCDGYTKSKRKVVILKRTAAVGAGGGGGSMGEAGSGTGVGGSVGKKIKTITVTTSEPALLVEESDIPMLTRGGEMRLRQSERQQQNVMIDTSDV
uniref:Uncharacterized protein n=1 Tax=Anopheles maculatus TaxID=74869 RepID=A0A182SCT7_9DIPT